MASTSVLKLVVDGKEYNDKLKEAQSGLRALEASLKDTGKTFTDVDDKVVEYVRAIGQMDSTAKSSRGALRDMNNALTEMTVQYRGLSDAEKESPFGKALAESMQQLTDRAGAISDAMGDVQREISGIASDTRLFDQLSQGAQVATAGIQTLTGTFKLLGIDIGDDVKVIATLQSAMAITNGLSTIQNALQKESALMQGLNAAKTAIAAAAQQAYAVATGKATIAQVALNAATVVNPYVALAAAIGVTLVGAMTLFAAKGKDAVEAAKMITEEHEKLEAKIHESVQSYTNASSQFMNSASRLENLRKVYMDANSEISKTDILREASEEFKKLGISCKDLSDVQSLLVEQGGNVVDMLRLQGDAAALSALRMEKFKESFQLLMEDGFGAHAAAVAAGSNEAVKALDAQLINVQTRIQGIKSSLPKGVGGSSGNGGGGENAAQIEAPEGSLAALNKEMKDLQQQQSLVTSTDEWQAYADKIKEVQLQVKELKGELGINSLGNDKGISISAMLSDQVKERQESFGKQKINVTPVQPKKEERFGLKELGDTMNQINGGISNIVSGIQGLGIDLPKGFSDVIGKLQAITMILTSIEAFQKVGALLGIFSNGGTVGFAASGMVIPGTSYSGDNLRMPVVGGGMIGVNSGEVILNAAQAGVVADALSHNTSGAVEMQPWVDGERLFLGMNNTSKRMGQGEIVTTGTLRRLGLIN